jgi:hypothetical protein
VLRRAKLGLIPHRRSAWQGGWESSARSPGTAGPTPGTPHLSSDGWTSLYPGPPLRHLVGLRPGQAQRQGQILGIDPQRMLAAGLAPIGRWGRGVLPPPSTARSEALPATARDPSIAPASCRLANSASWTRSQTPAFCPQIFILLERGSRHLTLKVNRDFSRARETDSGAYKYKFLKKPLASRARSYHQAYEDIYSILGPLSGPTAEVYLAEITLYTKLGFSLYLDICSRYSHTSPLAISSRKLAVWLHTGAFPAQCGTTVTDLPNQRSRSAALSIFSSTKRAG